MGGRRRVRGSDARTLSIVALAMVLALIFVPSMGPGAVPTGLVTSVSPAAAVVHLLGDEVVASSPAPQDLRLRPLAPEGPLLLTSAALAGLGAVVGARWLLVPFGSGPPPIAVRTTRSGRSPPRAVASR